MSGVLLIKPISAKLKRDTETFGKMDPFCRVKIGSDTQETKVHNNGGKFPAWTDTLAFQKTNESLIYVQVWDKDTFKDDLVGECTLPLQSVIDKKKSSEWYTLSFKGKNAGEILMEVTYKNEYKEVKPQFGSPNSIMAGGMGNAQPFSPAYGVTYMLPQMYMNQQQQQPQPQPQQTYVQPMYSQPTMGQAVYTQQMQPQPMYVQPQNQPVYSQPTYTQPLGQPGYVQVGQQQQQQQPMSQPTYYQPQPQQMPTQNYYPTQQQTQPMQQNYYAPPGY